MKMHWFGIFVLVLLGLYACDKQDDLLGDHQVINQPTATRASTQLRSFDNCSYPGDGKPISGIGTKALSPGKYTFTRRLPVGQYRDRHFNVDLVIGGPIVVRSVYMDKRGSFSVYEGCFRLNYGGDWHSFAPYDEADQSKAKIQYEIIVENNATVSWNSLAN